MPIGKGIRRRFSTSRSHGRLRSRRLAKFSLPGIPHADDLVVYLGDIDIKWTPADDIGFEEGLTESEHVLEFVLQNREIQVRHSTAWVFGRVRARASTCDKMCR